MEAVTGQGAMDYVRRLEDELGQAAETFRSGPFDIAARVTKQKRRTARPRKRDRQAQAQIASGARATPLASREQVGELFLLVHDAGVADPKIMREKRGQPAPAHGSRCAGTRRRLLRAKVSIVCAVTPGAQAKVQAGAIVGMLAKDLGGKGGGRADMAQGGGALPAGSSLADVIDRWTAKAA